MKSHRYVLSSRALAGIAICIAGICFGGVSAAQEAKPSPQPQAPQQQPEPKPETFESLLEIVAERAKNLAAKAYTKPEIDLPQELKESTYAQYRGIRFNPDAALWRGQADFEIQLFHPGFLYVHPIKINIIDEYSVFTEVKFNENNFIYDGGAEPLKQALANQANKQLGFSGFRVHYPVNRPDYKDEMLVFQGASYFRPIGPHQIYGLSARGLAIDTGEPSGEEFPRFIEYWLIKPRPGDNRLIIGALLDSPSVAGAFIFSVSTGTNTVMDVKSRLYTREDIAKVGIAPLTSMFFYGETQRPNNGDFRPEVHDSDGLQIASESGEWIWRPLQNPKNLHITSSMVNHLTGFGLAQRDREMDHYMDLESKYERRPGIWVEPTSDWGPGRVELVEIPTSNETNDNIVAYWVSKDPVKAGTELKYDYTLSTFDENVAENTLAKILRTNIGRVTAAGQKDPPPANHRNFVVDFYDGQIEKLDAGLPVEADLQVSQGKFSDLTVVKIPEEGVWRVSFKLAPEGKSTVDMRLSIKLRGKRLSEVWNYVWASEGIQ